jgi:hypothetical protein
LESGDSSGYDKDDEIVSSLNGGDAIAQGFSPIDSAGPFIIQADSDEARRLEDFVKEAHKQDVKVLVYMSPYVYYTSNVDAFISNLEDNMRRFDLDGVYFDGLIPSALKSLELVRKTRNLLQRLKADDPQHEDKIYVQHSSWVTPLIYRSSHFRVPFYDAYADKLWVGEGVRRGDDDTWRLNYCGYNVSNTPSTLLPEPKPRNNDTPEPENNDGYFSPEEQIERQLKWRGELLVSPFADNATLTDRYNKEKQLSFRTKLYWDKLEEALTKLHY